MPRLIKKYANRRLYDTETSRYIKLEDLKQLIVSGAAVQIVDAKTGKDISREVLLQLVAEQELMGRPILSQALLTSLIRFYDHPMQKLASEYLESALDQLQNQQSRLAEQMQELMDSPANLASQLTRQQLEWMSELQKSFLASLSPSDRKDPSADE